MAGRLEGIPIAMLGGDKRELELARVLIELGVDLRVVGFPRTSELEKARFFTTGKAAIEKARAILGPMSNTDMEGRILVRPDRKDEPIDLTEIIPLLLPKTYLFLGVAKPVIRQLAEQYRIQLVETAENDEIAIYNSIPTAEGALQIAMEETPYTIHGARSLVVGFGRCGTTLARIFHHMGSVVTVATRDKADLARAYEMGLDIILMDDLFRKSHFDIIINTVPALVLTKPYLQLLSKDTLIIDIAAAPGGTDFAAAEQLGIKAISALSLPGKVAPVTAGKILTTCIPRLLEELLGGE